MQSHGGHFSSPTEARCPGQVDIQASSRFRRLPRQTTVQVNPFSTGDVWNPHLECGGSVINCSTEYKKGHVRLEDATAEKCWLQVPYPVACGPVCQAYAASLAVIKVLVFHSIEPSVWGGILKEAYDSSAVLILGAQMSL